MFTRTHVPARAYHSCLFTHTSVRTHTHTRTHTEFFNPVLHAHTRFPSHILASILTRPCPRARPRPCARGGRALGGPEGWATGGAGRWEQPGGASWARVCARTSLTRPAAFPGYARGCWVLRQHKSRVAGWAWKPPPWSPHLALGHPPGAGHCARRRQSQGSSRLVRASATPQ